MNAIGASVEGFEAAMGATLGFAAETGTGAAMGAISRAATGAGTGAETGEAGFSACSGIFTNPLAGDGLVWGFGGGTLRPREGKSRSTA